MKQLYYLLPPFMQNIAVTLANARSYYQKYGAIPFFRPLSKVVENLEIKINDQDVVKRINRLIQAGVSNTVYYKENAQNYRAISSLHELRELPVLRKEVFRSRNKDFVSKESTKRNSYRYKTSGTTGTPLFGAYALEDLKSRFEVVLSSQKSQGINYSRRVARFLGAKIGSEDAIYRKDYINNHFLFSIYNLSESSIEKYYSALVNNRIEIIEGYPSTIYSLVKLLKLKSKKVECVKHVMTTAEQLLDYQKEEIEDFFNCKIFDFYGSSEGSSYMYLSKEGYYINSNLVGFVEVVNDAYEPVTPGEMGRMLVTCFNTAFTPLIRYDIGDYCSINNEDNYTQEPLIIERIGGRVDDIFITEEGNHFSRFSLILKFLPKSVVESQMQLTQRGKNVRVEYVSALPAYSDLELKPFIDKFESLLGENYNFEFLKLNTLDKSKRGKLKSVVIIDNDKD